MVCRRASSASDPRLRSKAGSFSMRCRCSHRSQISSHRSMWVMRAGSRFAGSSLKRSRRSERTSGSAAALVGQKTWKGTSLPSPRGAGRGLGVAEFGETGSPRKALAEGGGVGCAHADPLIARGRTRAGCRRRRFRACGFPGRGTEQERAQPFRLAVVHPALFEAMREHLAGSR